MKYLNRPLLSVLCVALTILPGCASHNKTTTVTTEETRYDNGSEINDGSDAVAHRNDDRVATRTETTTEEVKEDHHRGVFGIIGDIIALPFRAVGALFTAIF